MGKKWDRLNTSSVTMLIERLKNESQYWTGYDPNLVEELHKSVPRLTEEYNDLVVKYNEEKTEHIHKIWRPVVTAMVVISCFLLFVFGCVYAGTQWSDAKAAAKKELLLEKEQILDIPVERVFEKEGFVKVIVPMHVPGYSTVHPISIWMKQE
jgi:hypothetical protein